jgi:predicted nucleotide-binding protein
LRAIEDCEIVRHDKKLAAKIAARAKFIDFSKDESLIAEGDDTDDVFLILRGSVAIVLNGQIVEQRLSGQLVGEMEAIEPLKKRIATVRCVESGRAAKLTGPDFLAILRQHPSAWRNIVLDFSDRLQYRTRATRRLPNAEPRLFIGSSKETEKIAMAIQTKLQDVKRDVNVTVWSDDGGFRPSQYPIDELLEHVDRADFALFILAPDDLLISRGKAWAAPRDNVIFEVGLFMGGLGRDRTLVMSPTVRSNGKSTKIWSDLLGLTRLEYQPGKADDRVPEISSVSVNYICLSLNRVIIRHKVR